MSGKRHYFLEGQRFGKLLVLEYLGKGIYLCLCDCGVYTKSIPRQLLQKEKISCGCYRTYINVKHGLSYRGSRHPLYVLYYGIKGRCQRKSHKSYKDYGGRGIAIDNCWLGENGFVNFFEWSMDNGWRKGLVLDRVNNDGNYSPNNCRWTTDYANSRNKRNNIKVKVFSLNFPTLQDACDFFQINRATVAARIKYGWSMEDSLTKEPREHRKR